MMDIKSFTQLVNSNTQYTDIKGQLNELTHSNQLMIMRSLSPKLQRMLWTLCEGQEADLNDLVPSSTPTGQPVRHYGKNTLPVLSLFEKRFMRTEDGAIWGYNEGKTRPIIGPGYFICRETNDSDFASEHIVIDYEQLPPLDASECRLANWPQIQSNRAGLSRFVYAHMHDYMRKVSDYVLIGRAYRHGKASSNYFNLILML